MVQGTFLSLTDKIIVFVRSNKSFANQCISWSDIRSSLSASWQAGISGIHDIASECRMSNVEFRRDASSNFVRKKKQSFEAVPHAIKIRTHLLPSKTVIQSEGVGMCDRARNPRPMKCRTWVARSQPYEMENKFACNIYVDL